MTFDETDVMRDSLQMIEREYACSRIKMYMIYCTCRDYGGAIERPVELLLADKKRWEQRICGSMKERRKIVCGYCNVNCCVIVDMRDDFISAGYGN